jgi:hypothetical protein
MAFSKTPKGGEYANVAPQFVTMKELMAMAEYIRNFQAKYSSKKSTVRKKANKY